jgi:hypothetical protein
MLNLPFIFAVFVCSFSFQALTQAPIPFRQVEAMRPILDEYLESMAKVGR